jgi:EH signature protein
MSLIEALRSAHASRPSRKADTSRFLSTVENIHLAFPTEARASALSVEEAAKKVGTAISNWNWERISVGTVSLVCRAHLQGRDFGSSIRDFVRRELDATTSGPLLEAVAEAYLYGWQSRSEATVWMATLLQARSRHLTPRWKQLFLAVPEFLETEHAPTEVAGRMLPYSRPYTWLESLGLASPHSGSLMKAVHYAYLAALPAADSSEDVDRIFAWIRPDGRPAISDELAAAAIEKLLDPWISVNPESEFRRSLLERITAAYGDPRQVRAEFWKLVPQSHVQVLLRWLAGQSMDALLKVITRATSSGMWETRHHFWKGLYDRGMVDEAWVALSSEAATIAGRMSESTGDAIFGMAGVQTSKKREDTCLLIMRIGRYVVVEGSHDYRVHLFRQGDPKAPALYLEEYDAEKMTLPQNDPMTRIHDTGGRWTNWVRERVLR